MVSYQDNDPKGWMGDPKRGAALGRPTIQGPLGEGETLTVVRKQLECDYDENGTYFGGGPGTQPLFWVSSEDGGIDYVIRANDISDARVQVHAKYPGATIGGDSYNVSLDIDTLQQLLDSEVESLEADPNVVATVNDEIKAAAKEFEEAVWKVLEQWVSDHIGWLVDGDYRGYIEKTVCELSNLDGGAGYLYYMEAEGAGIGTWDGRWDSVFINRETIRELSKVVKKATSTEYNKLKTTLENCAFSSVPEEEDDEDEDEDEA